MWVVQSSGSSLLLTTAHDSEDLLVDRCVEQGSLPLGIGKSAGGVSSAGPRETRRTESNPVTAGGVDGA